MVTLKYLTHEGDTPKNVTVQQAKTEVSEAIDRGSLVYDEEERRIVTKATMNQIKDESTLVVLPAIQGG